MVNKLLTILLISFVSFSSAFANEPTTKAEQCETYGSYQDEDGNWQTCESEEDTN